MKKKILLIGFCCLLIGLVVGVAIGYLVTPSPANQQGQIDELQNQINSLENQVNDLQNQTTQKDSQIQELQEQISDLESLFGPTRMGSWNLVETFEGSSGLKTDYFYNAGTDLRINWTWSSSIEIFASFSITLYEEGQTIYTEMYSYLEKEGTTFAHDTDQAYYYLDMDAAGLDQWTVTVEAWIPNLSD